MNTLTLRRLPALLLLFAGCEDMGVVSRQMQDDDIKEAVFRYQLVYNNSGYIWNGNVAQEISVFGFAAADLDPVDFIIRRFYDLDDAFYYQRLVHLQRPARKYSQLRNVLGAPYYDLETGGQALLFWVGPIRWTSALQVEAEGGYYAGGRNSEKDVFFLSGYDDSWQVDSLRMRSGS